MRVQLIQIIRAERRQFQCVGTCVCVCDSSTGTCNMQESGRHNQHSSLSRQRRRKAQEEKKKSLQAEQLKAAGVVFPFLFLSACLSLPPLPAKSAFLQCYTHTHIHMLTHTPTCNYWFQHTKSTSPSKHQLSAKLLSEHTTKRSFNKSASQHVRADRVRFFLSGNRVWSTNFWGIVCEVTSQTVWQSVTERK